LPYRRAAISALAFRRSQLTANLLMKLAEPPETPEPPETLEAQAVRNVAYDAMGQLTGMPQLGNDAEKWRLWWQDHRSLDQQRWYAALAENFARQSRRLSIENQQIRKRLLETRRQLYHAAEEEKREPLLIGMLTSASSDTRLLAIELMAQRFIDERVFGAELVQTIIGALDDPSVAVRGGVTRLVLDLNNPDGADVMARRLVDGSETAPQVLRVYLLMMADRPRASAIPRALALLGDKALRDEAAGVLAGAAERDLLTEQQQIHLHEQLQGLIKGEQPPKPKVIELLGYVGDDADWQHIEQWLDSDKGDVKLAATRAWARSDRPLTVLEKRIADPAVQTIYIAAANSRGKTVQTLFTLVKLKPESGHSVEAWQRAIATVASRVEPADVMRADQLIVKVGGPITLRELVLTSAINKALPDEDENPLPQAQRDPQELVDLILTRADVRLQSGESKTALNDLAAIKARQWPMTDQQLSRHNALSMAARLLAGEPGEAFTLAADVLEKARLSGNEVYAQAAAAIARLVLDAAGRHVQANQPDEAMFLLTQLRETVGSALPQKLLTRLKKLEDAADQLKPVKTAEPLSTDNDS